MADQPVHIHLHLTVDGSDIESKLDQILANQEGYEEEFDQMTVDVSALTTSIQPLSDAVDSIQQTLAAQAALLADALADQGVAQADIDAAVAAVQAQTNELVAAALSGIDPGTVPDPGEPVDPNDLPHPDQTLPGDLPQG